MTARVIRRGLASIASGELPRGPIAVARWEAFARWSAQLVAPLSSLNIVDNHIELVFNATDDRRLRLFVGQDPDQLAEVSYASELFDHLRAEGAKFPIVWTR